MLLRWLRHTGQGAEQRALVARQIFQVEHLFPARGQRLQHARLRAARGAANDLQLQLRHQRFDLREHVMSKALVAARELLRVPADEAHPLHHRPAAKTAAPAIHQRLPADRLVDERAAQVPGQIGRHHRAAQAPCFEGACLLVERADDAALIVVEHRAVDGARDVVERELGRRARVDDRVEGVAIGNARRRVVLVVVLRHRRAPGRGAGERSQSRPARPARTWR